MITGGKIQLCTCEKHWTAGECWERQHPGKSQLLENLAGRQAVCECECHGSLRLTIDEDED